jgi:hypothetical protein
MYFRVMHFKNLTKYFIGGAVAGAIVMFLTKLYFGTQWDWDSNDLYSLIGFGFSGIMFLCYPKNKK